MVDTARAGGGNGYYGDLAEDLMDPFQQELELLGNLCLRELRLSASASDDVAVELANQLPRMDDAWRLPDLAWSAEAWVVLRLKIPATSLPRTGEGLTVVRVQVNGKTPEGEAVSMEKVGLTLKVLSPAEFHGLSDDEGVTRRLVELASAEALTTMRGAAARGDWAMVDRLLADARLQFAGNGWVEAVLAAMSTIAASRERERMLKESIYSSSKLRTRLVAKDESADFAAASEAESQPAYLRRKAAQGKGN